MYNVFFVNLCIFINIKKDTDERAKLIYEMGCVQAGEEWMEHNLILLASSAIILAFLQVSLFYIYFDLISIVYQL